MARGTTTLYLGDTSIRLLVTRGRRITKLADVPLDIALIDINTEEKENEIVNKIKLLFKTNRIRSKRIIVGISGLHCLTRPVSLPQLPPKMLDEAIVREAKRVLPVSPEQLYISWQTVGASEGKIQAFMVAIPRQIADTVLRMLHRAGFKPYLMDIKPLALARLTREATAVIVDVQSSEFDIIIMVNGIPQPIRTVPFQQESLTLAEKVATVREELRRTIQFYNTNNPDNPIQPDDTMLVSGELAEEPEMYESLAAEMRLKAGLLTSPLKCARHLDPSHHLTNVGLALKEIVKKPGPQLQNINTLPAPYLPKQVSLGRLIAIPTAAVALGSVVLLALTIQNAAGDIEDMQKMIDTNKVLLEKRQAQKKELTATVADLKKTLEKVQAERSNYASALKSFNTRGENMNGDLQAAVDNVVIDLGLENINLSEKQLNLSGYAASEVEVLEYARQLQATGRFEEITISNISRSLEEAAEGEGEGGGEGEGEEEPRPSTNFTLTLRMKEIP